MSVNPSTLDVAFARAQFPAFTHPDHGGWIHCENAGGSYVPRQVIDLLAHFYTATKVQPYAVAGPARAGGEAMDRARELLPATLGAAADEVHFGPSTSQNTYVLARAMVGLVEPGHEVIVTNQDHEANIGAWRRMAEFGVVVKEWSVRADTGLLHVEDLQPLLSKRTKLVCVTHASNVVATVNPIREIADLAHQHGARLVVDGVAWAPHGSIDVNALGCDVYLYSTYKTYGPHLGLMYCKRDLAEQLSNQSHFFKDSDPRARLNPAGPDHGAIAASAGIVDYYEALYAHHFGGADDSARSLAGRIAAVFTLMGEHEERLMAPLLEFLQAKGARVIGATEPSRGVRAPTIAFTSPRSTPQQIVETLAAADIGIGHGDFYARRLIEAMGLVGGVVRVSMVHYNTLDDVSRVMEALEPVV